MILPIPLLLLNLGAGPTLPEPLRHYLQAAEQNNHALGISRGQLEQQQAAVGQALSALTPTVQLGGNYTRNQYPAIFRVASAPGIQPPTLQTIVITPLNQLNATIGLNVPLIVPGGIARYAEARHQRDAAALATLASSADIQMAVVRAYYLVVASQGVLTAAEKARKTAEESERIAEAKVAAGTVTQLAVSKAQVDVALSGQVIANAQRALGLARRNLATLCGTEEPGELPAVIEVEATVQDEAGFVTEAEKRRPEIGEARQLLEQASASRDEAWLQLAPSLVAGAQEHITNATGFTGQTFYWTAGLTLVWTLDPVGTPASVRRADGQLYEQNQRLAQALDLVRDDVHTAWLDIATGRERLTETQSEVVSARQALKLTEEQFKAGTANAVDLSAAQRDAFNSEANLAQAQAELATALLAIRKAAGEPLLEPL
jgi:outer membrane protein TolC